MTKMGNYDRDKNNIIIIIIIIMIGLMSVAQGLKYKCQIYKFTKYFPQDMK